MRTWYRFLSNLCLLALCLFIVACLYGFGNVLNGDNIVSVGWHLLFDTFGS